MNHFNKPQASKIKGLHKVGFLGNNGQIFASVIYFYLLETKWNIQSLRSFAESVRGVSVGCLSKQSINQMVY